MTNVQAIWNNDSDSTLEPTLDDRDYYWVPKNDGWIPAKVSRCKTAGMLTATTQKGEVFEFPSSDQGDRITSVSALSRLPGDLVQMESVNEISIVYTLVERCKRGMVYTSIGKILIATNPFQLLPLYTPSIIDEYMHQDLKKLPPHPFGIARLAYTSMLAQCTSQAILISGDSGAGKTETTKLCLSFLSEIAGSPSGVEQKILSANPLLEAFGNAKTLRNSNSSRFGKFMELHFDIKGSVVSCGTINYLLEKSRVHSQAADERSYHIFYQLCCASVEAKAVTASKIAGEVVPSFARRKTLCILGNEDMQVNRVDLSLLRLDEPSKFHFLSRSECMTIEGVNDAESFYETELSAINLGVSKLQMFDLYAVCAVVLHLGNVTFTKNSSSAEGSLLDDSDDSNAGLSHAARLLGVEYDDLSLRLRTRDFTVRNEVNSIQLSPSQAADARDALCKALYKNAFDWLVRRCNEAMSANDGVKLDSRLTKGYSIGILDIFGFEIFELNGFEQLCINFANEKLQQYFNQHIFKYELDACRRENISYEASDFTDNQHVLDLIEAKGAMGILSVLDDEVKMPKATNITFLNKLKEKHMNNPTFAISKTSFQDSFGILHYAAKVFYKVDEFIEKNRDFSGDNLDAIIQRSKLSFGYGIDNKAEANDFLGRAKTKQTTVAGQFRVQLDQLVKHLNSTTPHFIRCIKPNENKLPNCFVGKIMHDQLKHSGAFDALGILKRGFPFQYPHQVFIQRYRPLVRAKLDSTEWKLKTSIDQCRAILALLADIPITDAATDIQVGNTMVFWKTGVDREMSALRVGEVTIQSIAVQRCVRGRKVRKLVKAVKDMIPQINNQFMTIRARRLQLTSVQEEEEDKIKLSALITSLKFLKLETCMETKIIEEINVSEKRQINMCKMKELLKMSPTDINRSWIRYVEEAKSLTIVTEESKQLFNVYDEFVGEGAEVLKYTQDSLVKDENLSIAFLDNLLKKLIQKRKEIKIETLGKNEEKEIINILQSLNAEMELLNKVETIYIKSNEKYSVTLDTLNKECMKNNLYTSFVIAFAKQAGRRLGKEGNRMLRISEYMIELRCLMTSAIKSRLHDPLTTLLSSSLEPHKISTIKRNSILQRLSSLKAEGDQSGHNEIIRNSVNSSSVPSNVADINRKHSLVPGSNNFPIKRTNSLVAPPPQGKSFSVDSGIEATNSIWEAPLQHIIQFQEIVDECIDTLRINGFLSIAKCEVESYAAFIDKCRHFEYQVGVALSSVDMEIVDETITLAKDLNDLLRNYKVLLTQTNGGSTSEVLLLTDKTNKNKKLSTIISSSNLVDSVNMNLVEFNSASEGNGHHGEADLQDTESSAVKSTIADPSPAPLTSAGPPPPLPSRIISDTDSAVDYVPRKLLQDTSMLSAMISKKLEAMNIKSSEETHIKDQAIVNAPLGTISSQPEVHNEVANPVSNFNDNDDAKNIADENIDQSGLNSGSIITHSQPVVTSAIVDTPPSSKGDNVTLEVKVVSSNEVTEISRRDASGVLYNDVGEMVTLRNCRFYERQHQLLDHLMKALRRENAAINAIVFELDMGVCGTKTNSSADLRVNEVNSSMLSVENTDGEVQLLKPNIQRDKNLLLEAIQSAKNLHQNDSYVVNNLLAHTNSIIALGEYIFNIRCHMHDLVVLGSSDNDQGTASKIVDLLREVLVHSVNYDTCMPDSITNEVEYLRSYLWEFQLNHAEESKNQDFVQNMQDAIQAQDEGQLKFLLNQIAGMSKRRVCFLNESNIAFASIIDEAKVVCEKICQIREILNGVLEDRSTVIRMVEKDLRVIDDLNVPKFVSMCPLYSRVVNLVKNGKNALKRLHNSWQGIDGNEMKSCLKECQELKLVDDEMQYVEQLVSYWDQDKIRFYREILELNTFLNRTQMMAIASDQLNEFYHKKNPKIIVQDFISLSSAKKTPISEIMSLVELESIRGSQANEDTSLWHNYNKLRRFPDPELENSRKIFGATPIPTSLTKINDITNVRLSMVAFKCLLGYMGDRVAGFKPMLSQEFLSIANTNGILMDECYCQIMKQLTRNPTLKSRKCGLEILKSLLSCKLPSQELQPYVEHLLRINNEMDLISIFEQQTILNKLFNLKADCANQSLKFGWLYIQKGAILKIYVKRWVVVNSNSLTVFMKNDPTTMVGTLNISDLKEMRIRNENDTILQGKYYPFEVYDKFNTMQQFFPTCIEDRNQWLQALKDAQYMVWSKGHNA